MHLFLIATLDTKGAEAEFVRARLLVQGAVVKVLDAGCQGAPSIAADLSREEVFAAAGASLNEVRERADRGQAVAIAARGAAMLVKDAHERGELAGVIAIGGSAGTTIGTTAMRALPLGIPKVMVSTLASGQVQPYVGNKDILMLNSVVDIAGLNRISRPILANAAAALAGMVSKPKLTSEGDKRLIAATMFGVTTPCVNRAREVLEKAGFEVLVFHATGSGGRAMESLIDDGVIAGVLDITTTELADELVGGVLTAGPDRLNAAARRGIPQLVSVGAIDMVNFGPRETVPPMFEGRKFHIHNPTITLMRTTPDENAKLGEEIGRKVAATKGAARILLPTQGVSAIDRAGQPFDDPEARKRLFAAITASCGPIDCQEVDAHINDAAFAEVAAKALIGMISAKTTTAL